MKSSVRAWWCIRVLLVAMTCCSGVVLPATAATNQDYKNEPEYLSLRDSLHHAFNNADSARFFSTVKKLEDYLLEKNDLHAYYTQRCNEIIFNLNRQNVFEAYKLGTKLSKELTEKQLDKEMYMAINMMGHIHNYCGNKESAKKCFWEVIARMKKENYIESLPPIYMNLVNVYMDEDPDEALKLLDTAVQIAKDFSPERTFDMETRRTLSYYSKGDKEKFLEGYHAYSDGVRQGLSSVHGRKLDISFQAIMGNTDKAVSMAMDELDGAERYETAADIYEKAGRWREAYEALKKVMAANDSVNSVILGSSMQGIQDELKLYEAERRASKNRMIALTSILIALLGLIVALSYFAYIKRKHEHQLKKAYQQVLESDKMKTAFIQNVSHEVRTPLNIISGFAQVIANPELSQSVEDRKKIADTMMHNTQLITSLIDETLELARNEKAGKPDVLNADELCGLLQNVLSEFQGKDMKSIMFVFKQSLPVGLVLNTKVETLKRIVESLLDNAVKNTNEGKITLSAVAKKHALTITVEDSGCGVPASEAERIFERFVKLDNFKEGLGLGLPLCRTLASRLEGRVWLDTSYAGPGARFCLELPLH